MKITAAIISLTVFLNAIALAEVNPAKEGESIRNLINRLNNEYIFLDEALKELEDSIRDFPDTTLDLSVIKRDSSISLVYIEVLDIGNNDRLLQSHMYTPIENKALNTGGRHQLYQGEIGEGIHRLNVRYSWIDGDNRLQKDKALITLAISSGKNYFIELSFERRFNKMRLRHSQSEFDIR